MPNASSLTSRKDSHFRLSPWETKKERERERAVTNSGRREKNEWGKARKMYGEPVSLASISRRRESRSDVSLLASTWVPHRACCWALMCALLLDHPEVVLLILSYPGDTRIHPSNLSRGCLQLDARVSKGLPVVESRAIVSPHQSSISRGLVVSPVERKRERRLRDARGKSREKNGRICTN